MVLLGLLLLALICLVLGLVLSSGVWLVASLIASIGAGYLLFRLRHTFVGSAPGRPVASEPSEEPPAILASALAGAPAVDRDDLAAGAHDAAPGGVSPAGSAAETAVVAATPAAARAERVAPPGGAPSPALPGGDEPVWVVDGRPRYHRHDCAIIVGQQAEEIPLQQAGEDGFMPCSLCEPSTVPRP